jgi:hypothetical protein
MKLSTTKESSLLSASTTTTAMPQGPNGRVDELHSQVAARPDASASAWLCHKGPIARLVSHIRMLHTHLLAVPNIYRNTLHSDTHVPVQGSTLSGPPSPWDPPVDWGFTGIEFILKSDEWSRSKCKSDRFAFTQKINDTGIVKSLISKTRDVSMCDVPKLSTTSPYSNWGHVPFNGTHAVWLNSAPYDVGNDDCPADSSNNLKGDRCDFTIRLADSGDGKFPTTVYVGARSIFDEYCT